MGYLFSVKDRKVCFNGKSFEIQKPSYFGEPNFLDGDLSLPPTKENITAVSIAFTLLFMNSGGMFVDPNYFGDKHNRDGRLFVNYSKIKDGNQYVEGSGDIFSKDTRFQNVNNPTGGWCWFASGTLHRFFYKDFDLYKSVCKINPDTFHWWLQDKLGNVIDLTEEQYLINGITDIRKDIFTKSKTGKIKPFRPLRTSYALKTKNMAYFIIKNFSYFDVPIDLIKVHNYDK